MSVFNAGAGLAPCMQSILGQQGVDLELIAIDDGSTDGSGAALDAYAQRDARVRVLHQENRGLTKSLIRGCAQARGDFIARHDAEDISLPGRLRAQCDYLRAHPDVPAVASGLRFTGPGGEWIYDFVPDERIQVDIAGTSVALPPLACATFRRDVYLRTGGFRETFVVAQDVDMWLRLLECGPCAGLREVHYEAALTRGGISSLRRGEQLRMAALALACARRRREGGDESELLAAYRPGPRQAASGPRERAAFHYFVGSCLHQRDPEAARRYYRLAMRDNPWHLKALVRSLFT
jgi:glycosyltransferase involved in cell wall biosynthesis